MQRNKTDVRHMDIKCVSIATLLNNCKRWSTIMQEHHDNRFGPEFVQFLKENDDFFAKLEAWLKSTIDAVYIPPRVAKGENVHESDKDPCLRSSANRTLNYKKGKNGYLYESNYMYRTFFTKPEKDGNMVKLVNATSVDVLSTLWDKLDSARYMIERFQGTENDPQIAYEFGKWNEDLDNIINTLVRFIGKNNRETQWDWKNLTYKQTPEEKEAKEKKPRVFTKAPRKEFTPQEKIASISEKRANIEEEMRQVEEQLRALNSTD